MFVKKKQITMALIGNGEHARLECGRSWVQDKPRSDHTKDYGIGICCFSAKHATLRRKSKD